jgi:protein dithiol:quinone oxidoreductase
MFAAKAEMHPITSARAMAAIITTGALLAVGVALLSQYRFDMQPCPWCVFQRLLLLAIAVVAAMGCRFGRGSLGCQLDCW